MVHSLKGLQKTASGFTQNFTCPKSQSVLLALISQQPIYDYIRLKVVLTCDRDPGQI